VTAMSGTDRTSAPDGLIADALSSAALALARKFARGATMWCVAPEWPSHSRHVAVEFVHPVIVGKRSLPAVDMDASDPVSALRVLARPEDVLLVASSVANVCSADLMRRAEAWGLTRLWLGAGTSPAPSNAEHVIWLEGTEAETAARSGDLVMLYHLLWELTHVVFEHPGLLDVVEPATQEACVTCSDTAVVGEVRRLCHSDIADAIVGGTYQSVDVGLVAPVSVGDLVLVHAGVAITTLDQAGPYAGARCR